MVYRKLTFESIYCHLLAGDLCDRSVTDQRVDAGDRVEDRCGRLTDRA